MRTLFVLSLCHVHFRVKSCDLFTKALTGLATACFNYIMHFTLASLCCTSHATDSMWNCIRGARDLFILLHFTWCDETDFNVGDPDGTETDGELAEVHAVIENCRSPHRNIQFFKIDSNLVSSISRLARDCGGRWGVIQWTLPCFISGWVSCIRKTHLRYGTLSHREQKMLKIHAG